MGFSCGLLTERAWEGRSGWVKRAVAAIWARMSFRVFGGRLVRDVPAAYIIPFTPSSACIFLSPPIHRSSHLHEYGGRQGLFGTTWSQHQFYPRHTSVYSPLLPPWVKVFSCISQKLVVIGGTVETARRASISAWNGFVDCSYLFLRRYG